MTPTDVLLMDPYCAQVPDRQVQLLELNEITCISGTNVIEKAPVCVCKRRWILCCKVGIKKLSC